MSEAADIRFDHLEARLDRLERAATMLGRQVLQLQNVSQNTASLKAQVYNLHTTVNDLDVRLGRMMRRA